MPEVICQLWEESEREPGWGVTIRPDGFSLHKSREHLDAFLKAHWANYPKEVPDFYIRPCGTPFLAKLRSDSKLYQRLLKSRKKGIRLDNEAQVPKKISSIV